MVDDKKERKKAIIKKNRKTQEIFQAFRLMREEGERQKREEEKQREGLSGGASSGDDAVWSEKVATIRNRLTGQKRVSKERWNRFAGTEGGGGRGL